jgi:hypothetical protein
MSRAYDHIDENPPARRDDKDKATQSDQGVPHKAVAQQHH